MWNKKIILKELHIFTYFENYKFKIFSLNIIKNRIKTFSTVTSERKFIKSLKLFMGFDEQKWHKVSFEDEMKEHFKNKIFLINGKSNFIYYLK